MDAFLTIASKRDLRAYAPRPLPADVVQAILEAGRVAGSARNRQERRFHVLETPTIRERAAEAVTRPSNVAGAALAIAITVYGKGSPFDAGRAAQNMMLAAADRGVASCPNSPRDRDAMAEILDLGEGEDIVTVLSLGYPARSRRPEELSPAQWLDRADRKPLTELVRWL